MNKKQSNLTIKEVENDKKIVLSKFDFSCDDIDETIPKPLPQTLNFFMLISGKPASGKTSLILNLVVKEDYESCLRHIRDKGGILGIRYLHWENDHWGKDGGCKDYRTIDIERKAIKNLIKFIYFHPV